MSEQTSNRFDPLDVLRGLAVLGMGLSSMVPYQGLPACWYHAQEPPPTREFTEKVFGITWVDLVFPFFLFAMGAAIPLAISRRLDKGGTWWQVLWGLFTRGVLLAAYALFGEHLRPYTMAKDPNPQVWGLSLLGFVLVALILARWPKSVPVGLQRTLTAAGWVGAALVIGLWVYPDGTRGFANYRNDIILMVLANVAVSAGAVWLFTRQNAKARLFVWGAVAAIFLTSTLPGLGKLIWDWDPSDLIAFKNGPQGRFLPVIYHFEYHKYLMMVLIGTFAGDAILGTLRGEEDGERSGLFSRWAIGLLGPGVTAIVCAGLLGRQVAWTMVAAALALALGWRLAPVKGDRWERLAVKFVAAGGPLLLIGLLCEPIGGGIRKDSATFSYFLVAPGLALLVLASLTIAGSRVSGSRLWRSIRDTGSNPIMGYVVITNLVAGLVGITHMEEGIGGLTQNPWWLLAWGFAKTVFVAIATAWFTRRKWFLRA